MSNVIVIGPACVRDDGLNVTFEFGGWPVAWNVVSPTDGFVPRLIWKENVPELPAVTVTVVGEIALIAIGKTVVGSEAASFEKSASAIPDMVTELETLAGEPSGMLATTEIGG